MAFRQEENKLVWEMGQERIQIEAWGPEALRVRGVLNAQIEDDPLSALLEPVPTNAEITIGNEQASIKNGALKAEIDSLGTVRFLNDATGEELIAETWQRFPQPERRFKSLGSNLFRSQVKFKAYDDERFYGLGQRKHGKLDQKGCVIDLLQLNSKVCIPFLLSNRGYGFLWNNPAVGRVELGQNHTRWIAEATAKLDYWITLGDTPAQIVERYVDATGHAPMLPEWAAGFWQCKLRYTSQNELLAVARDYKARGLPLSVIVIDYFHWTSQGDWKFDSADWPDPAGMVEELEANGGQGDGVGLAYREWRQRKLRNHATAWSADRNQSWCSRPLDPDRHQRAGITRTRPFHRLDQPRSPDISVGPHPRGLLSARNQSLLAGCLRTRNVSHRS